MNTPGRLEVVCGSMFSGKTEEMIRRLRRAEYAKKKVLTIKHKIDNRKSYSCIVSHDGETREAYPITSCEEGLDALLNLADPSVDVIGIDEIQFFPEGTIAIIEQFIDMGKRVIVAGLDTDFRGEPFGIVPYLMAIADSVTKLHAICVVCGGEANHTQRLVNGEPADYNERTILVGGEECYEARCRRCYRIEKQLHQVVCESN